MAYTGVAGDVEAPASTDVADVLSWSFNESCNTSRRATSDSAGYKNTYAGTKMADGEIRRLADDVTPAYKSGDSVTLKLQMDGNSFISAPAVIKSRSLSVDIDEGAVVEEVLGWESHGAWSETHA